MGITILEFDQIWRNDPKKAQEYDLKYEEYQKSLDPKSNIVLDSRLSFWCQPDAFNVFLDVSDDEWARRIYNAQRSDDANESYEAVLQANQERHSWLQSTYIKLYDVDLYNTSNYDIYIDTSDLTPDEVYTQILQWYTTWQESN